MAYVRNFLDAYWEKVDVRGPDDCWEWTKARYHDGYGMLNIRPPFKKSTMRAHVFSLILASGEDAGDRFALHSCDNPPCCNPAHLRWGNQKANIADMDSRGRARRPITRGMQHGGARLTDLDVLTIRALWKAGRHTQQQLADHFGVTQANVSDIVLRKRWKHLP